MKKIISTLCLLALCIVCFAKSFTYTYYGVTFKCKIEKGTVSIVDFNSDAEKVVVPANVIYNGTTYQVKSVNCFKSGGFYKGKATVLVVEEGIERIEQRCFFDCRKLRTISLPSSLKYVGKNAFADRENTKFYLPSFIDETALRDGDVVDAYVNNFEVDDLLAKAELERQEAENKNNVSSNNDGKQKAQNRKTSTPIGAIVADVDKNIPISNVKNANTYCVIIANEQYKEVPNVEFASNDGAVFGEYCTRTLGIPEKQIRMFTNATYTDMKRAFNWIENVSKIAGSQGKVIVYYAGHGLPSEEDNSAYLMPTDCFPKDITTCFKLQDIYKQLGKMNVKNVTVFLDACFSGMQRGENEALLASRGVATRPRSETLTGNVIVFSAASNDQTALSYKDKRHGMFTYYLLLKLKESKGIIGYGDLYKSVYSEVQKYSLIENDKLQTPSVNVASGMRGKWYDLNF